MDVSCWIGTERTGRRSIDEQRAEKLHHCAEERRSAGRVGPQRFAGQNIHQAGAFEQDRKVKYDSPHAASPRGSVPNLGHGCALFVSAGRYGVCVECGDDIAYKRGG